MLNSGSSEDKRFTSSQFSYYSCHNSHGKRKNYSISYYHAYISPFLLCSQRFLDSTYLFSLKRASLGLVLSNKHKYTLDLMKLDHLSDVMLVDAIAIGGPEAEPANRDGIFLFAHLTYRACYSNQMRPYLMLPIQNQDLLLINNTICKS